MQAISVFFKKYLSFKDKKGSASKAGGVIQITKNFPTLAAMTGDKKMLEINQRREGGRYLPPRDTFLLSVQGDVISAEAMGEKEFAKCFNPSNLSLSIVGEKKKDGYVVYDQDYTKVNFAKLYLWFGPWYGYRTEPVTDPRSGNPCLMRIIYLV